ncbi:putative ABC transporter permease [Listeria weihenstephanensis FSL R9-0317]|nr:putative ABC transporter permease [Listeria weihenstephanensis FSL R9-0317]
MNYLKEVPLQFLYQSVVLILFGVFFFLLTTAVRSTLVSIIALFLYMLLVPNLGGFDLKNLMLLTVSKIYNTSAATMDVVAGEDTNLILGYVATIGVWILLIVLVYKIDKKRSCPRL